MHRYSHASCSSDSERMKLRKGLWSPEEDERLASHIARYGVSCWSSIPELAGLRRCGKSCRLRWMNYLRPDLKRGRFSQSEEDLIMALHDALGNSWSQIAARLPGRSDNEIKNFWNARLRKKLRQKETTKAESRGEADADGKPAAVSDHFSHHSLSSGNNDDDGRSSNAAAAGGNAVHRADEPRSGDVALANVAGHRNNAAADDSVPAVAPPSTSASAEAATRDHEHGDGGFLAAMAADDDEASFLLGEYYLDGSHDGFYWGEHVFS